MSGIASFFAMIKDLQTVCHIVSGSCDSSLGCLSHIADSADSGLGCLDCLGHPVFYLLLSELD